METPGEFYKPIFQHHSRRRKKDHDYCSVCRYHITIQKSSDAPPFSQIIVNKLSVNGVNLKLTPLGEIIDREIKNFQSHHPAFWVYEHVVMPDHIHILVGVIMRIPKPLGSAIGGLKSGIAKEWRSLTNNRNATVFEQGFNDKIIFPFRSLPDVIYYIQQNPYRLAVRKARPAFFQRCRGIKIGDREVQGYGNLFLLRNPFKTALIVHRADSEEVFRQKKENCLEAALNGEVIVSAFISPREREILREVEKVNGKVIKIQESPFKEREKPARHDFEQCVAGNLLLLSPLDWDALPRREHPTRSQCLEMNKLAERLAGGQLA